MKEKWKWILMFLVLFMFLPTAVLAKQISVTWDANDPVPEGYRVFMRADGLPYNYTIPVCEGIEIVCEIPYTGPVAPPMVPANNIDLSFSKTTSVLTVRWEQADPITLNELRHFVVRAYEGQLESTDSNEVSYTFTASNEALWWGIEYSSTLDGAYTTLATKDAGGDMEIVQPFNEVPIYTSGTFYFRIVTFGANDVSVMSTPVAFEIDRTRPAPPGNMRMYEVPIPVE